MPNSDPWGWAFSRYTSSCHPNSAVVAVVNVVVAVVVVNVVAVVVVIVPVAGALVKL